ncbi:hypothetical protein GLO73106DRAFT_00034690 [Gloeocapsa sp. PCC 73106]|nr:hypothetical protein GLO73106DRAFT_00034690 [Gloeocapsa sp. PCC 73106]
MGLASLAYMVLGISGFWLHRKRTKQQPRPVWLRPFHYLVGGTMVLLVLTLLSIGLVGTIGYYGSLGHSPHLLAGVCVVLLVLISAGSATQIGPKHPQARSLHVGTNLILLVAFIFVSVSGWQVVQKYLP